MLIVLIHNNQTGDGIIDNYDVEVRMNDRVLSKFPVNGHTRAFGWVALLEKVTRVAWVKQIAMEDKKDREQVSVIRKATAKGRRITPRRKVAPKVKTGR